MQLKAEAFAAFQKYQELDPRQIHLVLDSYAIFFDLYNGYFDIGAKEFSKKHFTASYNGFKNALAIEEFVKNKGYSYKGFQFPDLDTSLV